MTLRALLPALFSVVVFASGCASEPSSSATSTSVAQSDSSSTTLPTSVEDSVVTTTTEPDPEAVAPLTGVTGFGAPDRPALVVKIDNHDRARPQFGLNDADVVFEEVVEGGLTRFAAVFHSRGADVVGPVRSVRTSDFPVLAALGTPLFANSGGNDGVLALLRSVDMVDVSSNAAADAYHRDPDRSAPHNLVSDTSALWAAGRQRDAAGRPEPLFAYRAPDDPGAGGAADIRGVQIDYGVTEVTYEWDDSAGGWARSQNGSLHVAADGEAVAPTNVIVQFVSYGRSAADGRAPEAELVGTGAAWILTGGHMVNGTWERATEETPTAYFDEAGRVVALEPGVTWVALPRVGQVTVLG